MTAKDLARIVSEMREAQRQRHYTRSQTAIKAAERLEAKVDHCCQIILDGQGELFED